MATESRVLMEDKRKSEVVLERAILIAISPQRMDAEVESSLDELEELAKTAGASTLVKVIQNRDKPHPATYFGKGKVEELIEMVHQYEIDMVICDDELTPAQMQNLSDEMNIKVVDRPILIMDIFAKHAHTREGKLQVEMAQLKYSLSRLSGQGASMSRLGAGIGTRGPGETKLETDRRHVRRRIGILKDELEKVHHTRELLRTGRAKQGKPIISIIGYTNAGKSTLLNYLTDAGVLQENILFATLDPTTRNLVLPEGKEVLMVDTVGFIRKLPHQIVEAFKSTLEEVIYADILIHVVDAMNPDAMTHIEVVHQTLEELGADQKPMLALLNKFDLEGADENLRDTRAFKNLQVSAKTGAGIGAFLSAIEAKLLDGQKHLKIVVPYAQGNILQKLRSFGQIVDESYVNEGTYLELYIEEAYVHKFGLNIMRTQ